MRLNGRVEIMAYLGRRYNPKDQKGWRKVRGRYVEVLHYLPGSFWVWTTSEELDALDRSRSLTLERALAAKARSARGSVREGREGDAKAPPQFRKLVREIFLGLAKQGKWVGGVHSPLLQRSKTPQATQGTTDKRRARRQMTADGTGAYAPRQDRQS
jgi:hypothetical protein